MHGPKLNRYLSLIAATLIGNLCQVRGAEPICSAPLDPASILGELDKRRPVAIGPDQRAAALGALPREGQVRRFSLDDTRKLESLDEVLRVHDRQSVYTVVV